MDMVWALMHRDVHTSELACEGLLVAYYVHSCIDVDEVEQIGNIEPLCVL